MKLLFFIVHPSKVKVLSHTINALKANGHECDVAITSKDVLEALVISEGWKYTNVFPEGRKMKKINRKIGAIINTFRTVYRLRKLIGKKKYDLFVTDDLLVVNGKLRGVPTFLLQDDDITAVPESALLFFFTKYILSPSVSNMKRYNKKKISFFGYKELGGLHPKRFIPDFEVVKKFNPENKKYFILRLVSLAAVHDSGKKGLQNEDVEKLIGLLEEKGNVYITTERELPDSFEKYRINIPPNEIAQALYFAEFLISDSQTMSAEAGVLGTPYIRFNDFVGRISYLEELENKYNLGIGIRSSEKDNLFKATVELLETTDLKKKWLVRKEKMLSEKIDLTGFLIWLFENYPTSTDLIRANPEYQQKFR